MHEAYSHWPHNRKLKDGYQNTATLWQVDFARSCNNISISSYLLSQTVIDLSTKKWTGLSNSNVFWSQFQSILGL